jgi:hypothetical protein
VQIEPDQNDAVILAVTVAIDAMVHPGKQGTLRRRAPVSRVHHPLHFPEDFHRSTMSL